MADNIYTYNIVNGGSRGEISKAKSNVSLVLNGQLPIIMGELVGKTNLILPSSSFHLLSGGPDCWMIRHDFTNDIGVIVRITGIYSTSSRTGHLELMSWISIIKENIQKILDTPAIQKPEAVRSQIIRTLLSIMSYIAQSAECVEINYINSAENYLCHLPIEVLDIGGLKGLIEQAKLEAESTKSEITD
jgi:hypothetical protein